MARFFLFIALFSFGHSRTALAERVKDCLWTLAPAFQPGDFGASAMWKSSPQADRFPIWASDQANQVQDAFVADRTTKEIFDFLGEHRAQFAVSEGHAVGNQAVTGSTNAFGHWRKGIPFRSYVEARGGVGSQEWRLREIANAQMDARPPLEDPKTGLRIYVNTHRLLSGEEIPATKVRLDSGPWREDRYYALFHPGETLHLIWDDVVARIDLLRRSEVDGAFDANFLRALQGFYQAMPYERGSASIGRVFFASLYRFKTGRKLVDFVNADVESMLMDAEEFIRTHSPASRAL